MTQRSFALIGLMVLCALALVIRSLLFLHPSPGDGASTMFVRFQNVDKISPGTRVSFAGKVVGEVKRVRLVLTSEEQRYDSSRPIYPYEIELAIDSSVVVYTTDEISIKTAGLMGERCIAITPKPAGETALVAVTPSDIMIASQAGGAEETLREVAIAAKRADKTLELLISLIEKNQDNVYRTTQSLSEVSMHLSKLLQTIEQEQLVSKMASLSTVATSTCQEVSAVARHVEESHMIPALAAASKHLCSITESCDHPQQLSAFVTQLPNLQAVATELTNTLASVRDTSSEMHAMVAEIRPVIAAVHQRQGSLGKLIYDPTLYNMTKQIASDIQHYGLLFHFSRTWNREQAIRDGASDESLRQAVERLQQALMSSQRTVHSADQAQHMVEELQHLQEQIAEVRQAIHEVHLSPA